MKQLHLGKLATAGLLALVMCLAGSASAGTIPSGWTCVGNCGQAGVDGVVPLSPYGSSQYQWVSSAQAVYGAGVLPTGSLGGETDGSTLSTSVFAANAGDQLDFYFNYVTSDGSGYADYGWAALMNADNTMAALLFTARTKPSPNNIVPGVGMPAPSATLVPPSVPIQNGSVWSPLGGYSGGCYAGVGNGCGHSGWVEALYTISVSGNYYLKIGVTDWSDQIYDSGLAMDGVKIAGNPILPPTGTPEPGTLVLLCGGFLPFVGRLLRRR